jgi:hypothetical protein
MDPFSITAGVAGLLSITIQLIQIAGKFKHNSRSEQLYDFIFELNSLAEVLKRLQGFLSTQEHTQYFDQISVFVSSSTRCKTKLSKLLQKLQTTVSGTNKIKRVIDTLIWPLDEKEHRETIKDLQRYIQLFHFALTVEGCTLLSKSSTEVTAGLQTQIRQIEETKALCVAIPDLAVKLDITLSQISDVVSLVNDLSDQSAKLTILEQNIVDLKFASDST